MHTITVGYYDDEYQYFVLYQSIYPAQRYSYELSSEPQEYFVEIQGVRVIVDKDKALEVVRKCKEYAQQRKQLLEQF
jgi:hypothetical protein